MDVSPVGHFSEYLVLGAALCNALRFHLKPQGPAGALLVAKPISELSKWAPIVAAALSSLYGVTDEFHQIFTPGRSCDPMDWLVDTIAAALARSSATWCSRLCGQEGNANETGPGSSNPGPSCIQGCSRYVTAILMMVRTASHPKANVAMAR